MHCHCNYHYTKNSNRLGNLDMLCRMNYNHYRYMIRIPIALDILQHNLICSFCCIANSIHCSKYLCIVGCMNKSNFRHIL